MKQRHSFFSLYQAISIIGALIILTSCATSSITSVSKLQTERPFSGIMVVCIQTEDEFRAFNAESYSTYVYRQFNSFDDMKVREHLEKSLAYYMAPEGFPRVLKASDAFNVDEDYSYEQFLAKVKRSGVEALLVVNMSNYWYTSSYVSTHYEHSTVTRETSEPNSTYYAYLYDVKNLDEYVWIGKVNVHGIYAGYDTLNNYFARKISGQLRHEKYIY